MSHTIPTMADGARSADAIIVSKMAARRPLSPSVLGATTAAKTDLAVDHSCGDAIVGA